MTMPSDNIMKMAKADADASKTAPKPRKAAPLPPSTIDYLKAWILSPEHIAHPYPTDQEKARIMADTGIEMKQLTNWFVNNRKRFWKPRMEAQRQQRPAPPVPAARVPALVPAAAAPAASPASRPRAIHRAALPPPPPQGTPSLPARGDARTHAAALFAQAPPLARATVGEAARSPRGGAPRREDPHAVSEGSGASSCGSDSSAGDDDSLGASAASGWAPRPAGASADPRLAPVGRSLVPEVAADHVSMLMDASAAVSQPAPRLHDVAANAKPVFQQKPVPHAEASGHVPGDRYEEILRAAGLSRGGVNSNDAPPRSSPAEAAVVRPTVSAAVVPASASSAPKRPRAGTGLAHEETPARPGTKRARAASAPQASGEEEWRSLCRNATGPYCASLPGLEEAVRMLGRVSPV